MRTYQLVLVLRPSLTGAEKKKFTESVKTWLKEVKIVKEEEWGQKPLSFKIKKESSGLFLNYYLETVETVPLDFEKRLLAHDDILRHLLIRSKDKSSSVAKAKEDKQNANIKKEKLSEAKSASGGEVKPKTGKKAKPKKK